MRHLRISTTIPLTAFRQEVDRLEEETSEANIYLELSAASVVRTLAARLYADFFNNEQTDWWSYYCYSTHSDGLDTDVIPDGVNTDVDCVWAFDVDNEKEKALSELFETTFVCGTDLVEKRRNDPPAAVGVEAKAPN